MTYKHDGPFESFLEGKKPNIPPAPTTAKRLLRLNLNPERDALVQEIASAMATGTDSGGYSTLLEMYAHIALTILSRSTGSEDEK